MKQWEKEVELQFDPCCQEVRRISKVNYKGVFTTMTDTPDCHSAEVVFQCAKSGIMPDLGDISYPCSEKFVAGQIHSNIDKWRFILGTSPNASQILSWLEHGVDIHSFLISFRGRFWGKHYDTDYPPPRYFSNANNCKQFQDFISQTVLERLRNGSIQCLGKVGHVDPPYIVAPLTVEPTKPRMCINLMYLNNWITDKPFSLDTLKDVPRVVNKGAFYTSLDDKSGFDNVLLSQNSQKFVGFQWGGYYFCFNTLPFGFKLSSYIYQTLNLQPTSYIRRAFSIPLFLYIDDRLIEQVRDIKLGNSQKAAYLANYLVCEVLTRLGYCLNLKKSIFVPTQKPVFLGFVIDSVEGCYRIIQGKLAKFAALRDILLSKSTVSVLDLQRLAGRCISFMLAIPAAKLYTREMNFAISDGLKGNGKVQLTGKLREELQFWKFIDSWEGKLTWKTEKHLRVDLCSDASLFKWGGIVHLPSGKVSISDFWGDEMRNLPIMVLEGHALLHVLQSVLVDIRCHRVDARVDNQVLINAWNKEGCKSREMNDVIKLLFDFTLKNEISLNLTFIESKLNEADAPSRILKKSEATICGWVWKLLQKTYGGAHGHTCDLMALDSNCMKGYNGKLLKHFTPYQTPLSDGINAFSQHISSNENCYVFPPFSLMLSVIRFIIQNDIICTLILPVNHIAPAWLPSVIDNISDAFIIGRKGQRNVLKFPSNCGFTKDRHGLIHDMWALRFLPHTAARIGEFPYGKSLLFYSLSNSSQHHFISIGDSVITFLMHDQAFTSPMVHVFAQGGALLHQVQNNLQHMVSTYAPKVILIHAGVNNASKTFLYRDEYEQMSVAHAQLCSLEQCLQSIVRSANGCIVILSSIIGTKDGFINARARIINTSIEAICNKNKWYYMNNEDILISQLRDCVHLNNVGERAFTRKVLRQCRAALYECAHK
ncbi:MAG: reverse transcriptase domain-containing protein [Sedimenticola sp.]